LDISNKLKEVGELVGIKVLDFIVIGGGEWGKAN
jgi:DNA repair protein RadC